jgi:hypothetical protein
VKSIISFFEDEFKDDLKDWEHTLLKELKLPEIGNKSKKEMMSGAYWPTLSIQHNSIAHLSPSLSWKKASTTYFKIYPDIELTLLEDLNAGVKNFFFMDSELSAQNWQKIENVLCQYHTPSELEVFCLNKNIPKNNKLKVINTLITGHEVHLLGGDVIHELATVAQKVIHSNDDELYVGVYLGTSFFQNIAKIRAVRLLCSKILQEKKSKVPFRVVALTSFEGWTLFERYSNILRNEASVASAFIGGADHIQSTGYNTLFETEVTLVPDDEHRERSMRMARNTSHILALESMLGIVEDASHGSYHLENLTHYYSLESWNLMQRLEGGEDLSPEIIRTREKKLQMIKFRKKIFSGINDYPDASERLGIELKPASYFRAPRAFEELRLKMEKINRPKVYVALFGDYAGLNARLNFTKNYFGLLGLEVIDSGTSDFDKEHFKLNLSKRDEEIVVLCSSDDDYPQLKDITQVIKTKNRFVAGKYEIDTCKNIFSGQNIYDGLKEILTTFGEQSK